jgi:hypothetical protein
MPTLELFKSDREFRIWSYEIGHRTLTLRSVKTPALPTRIDIRFVSVDSIALPTTMSGVMLLDAGPDHDGRRFIVRGAGYDGSVVAGAAAVHEDTGEFSDPAYWDDPRHIRGDI